MLTKQWLETKSRLAMRSYIMHFLLSFISNFLLIEANSGSVYNLYNFTVVLYSLRAGSLYLGALRGKRGRAGGEKWACTETFTRDIVSGNSAKVIVLCFCFGLCKCVHLHGYWKLYSLYRKHNAFSNREGATWFA